MLPGQNGTGYQTASVLLGGTGDGGTLLTDPPASGSGGDTVPVGWGMKFDGDKIDLAKNQSDGAAGSVDR